MIFVRLLNCSNCACIRARYITACRVHNCCTLDTQLSTAAAQGDWVRTVAKQEGIPVFVVKSGGRSNLVKALRTLLGIDPSAGGALLGGPQADDSRQRADGAVVSQVPPCCRLYREVPACFC